MDPVAFVDSATILPGLMRWPDLREGTSAVRMLEGEYPVAVGAPVPLAPIIPSDWPFPVMPRALGLAREALMALELDPNRSYALVLGLPNLYSETAYLEPTLVHRHEPEHMARLIGFAHDFPMNYLADLLPGCGPRLRVDAACATGNDALIVAHQWLSAGVVDNVVVVAASAMLNPVGLALFNNLQALNDRPDLEASCPFDARRRGFVMGEGAAAAWLTRDSELNARGYLCGYGQSMNAHKFVDLPEDIGPMAAACRAALGPLREVAYISAHGTATPINDAAETRLYKDLFGHRAAKIPISSIKSMIGHCLGAAALIEAITCLHALEEQMAPPTINLHVTDPACDLDYVANRACAIEGNFALSNAFAFGGHNSSILLSRERP